ncbi:hypothetical protein EST38_g2560 [Candolleomyces aberdarensis]|uniref:Uncharacterized protein n=1 Tax=Candolleomyces aberdarensis TaxID=2316362 RepID=A0A4Q2DUC3_9AGAR|nr:hypothetical protein EST38_g2560 [Candolleomyces aberdarensis]
MPSSFPAELCSLTESPHVVLCEDPEYEYAKEDDDLRAQSGNSGPETRSNGRSSSLVPIPNGDEEAYEESAGQERTLGQVTQLPISESSRASYDHLNMSEDLPDPSLHLVPVTAQPVPVLTEAWIYEDDVFEELQRYIKAIFAYMKENDVSFPRPTQPSQKQGNPRKSTHRKRSYGDCWEEGEHVEPPQDLAPVVLVLEPRLTGRVGYYFVDHPSQTLFWLEHFDFTYMLMEVRAEWSEWLAGLQMKSHYWYHNELFPHLYELVDDDTDEIDDIVGRYYVVTHNCELDSGDPGPPTDYGAAARTERPEEEKEKRWRAEGNL